MAAVCDAIEFFGFAQQVCCRELSRGQDLREGVHGVRHQNYLCHKCVAILYVILCSEKLIGRLNVEGKMGSNRSSYWTVRLVTEPIDQLKILLERVGDVY